MTRASRAWLAFGAAAAGLLVALGLLTRETLDLERRGAESQAQALREEKIRLALWRMDSALAQLLAIEGARPPEQYAGFRPRMDEAIETATASPPLQGDFRPFRLYFQHGGDRIVRSPQVPPPDVLARMTDEEAARYREPLERLEEFLRRRLHHAPGVSEARNASDETIRRIGREPDFLERTQRNAIGQFQAMAANGANFPGPAATFRTGPFVATWAAPKDGSRPELLFVRGVQHPELGSMQGIWANWPAMKEWLLAEAKGDFPTADLLPVAAGSPGDARTLASIPARFEPGPSPAVTLAGLTPTRGVLLAAWTALLLSLATAGWLLRAALDLGERRGRFVAGVTHELRTPLTTFRMYAQMLAEGMAPPGAEKEYLATLQRESERLSRVVESVLLYARLEEGRGGAHRERIGAGALLDRILPPAEKRLAEAGLRAEVTREVPADAALVVDPQAVEQVLLNLADNAAKYAAAGKSIEIRARACRAGLEILVQDRGPGIPAEDRETVFEPFRRLPRDEAGGAPGAGLGLALSRGIARALGGDLRLVPRDGPGAAFLLLLPFAR